MITVTKSDLRTRLSAILDLVDQDEVIQVTDHGHTIAKISKAGARDFPGPKGKGGQDGD